ncbi:MULTISPECIES: SdpI family protein [Corynebacterium]|uniref:SdpI family protein n=1 Tax=Corynebacterium provencense TaxID=1737425 RepID=A0A2Z3YPR9_9CORY|nr:MULTISPECIES: SdpI family protein [Corynebacterium]AWT27465.1 hypothetical protein Csp1_27220 [Corynebacterium provencense]MCI1255793.1 SdpI family protein [Corynebacterium provencense]
MTVLSVLLFILGVAVLVTGIMGLTGTLPGNRWVGLHVPEVRKSREMWTTAHRIVGPFWTGAGAAVIVGGLVSLRGGWMWAVAVLLTVGALGLIGVGAANAAHIVARIDLRKGQEVEARRAAAGCCSSGGGAAASSSGSSAAGSRTTGSAAADSCGGSCDDCGACDHADADLSGTTTTLSNPVLDLEAARRAVAARDSHSAR